MQDQNLMPAPAARRYLGNISDMCLWRWERNPEMGFPQPIRINKRKYFRKADLDAFIERRSQ